MDSGRIYAGKVVPKSTLQKSSAKKKVHRYRSSLEAVPWWFVIDHMRLIVVIFRPLTAAE
jgi:hypothetical protein